MFLKIWRFIAITLTTLLTGTSFAHTLELPAKMQYDGPLYEKLQKSLYMAWGPPGVGGFLDPGALLAMAVLAYLVRKRRPAFPLTLGATALLFLAFPVLYFLRVEPVNAAFRQATLPSLPPNWMGLRAQWEYGHASRFVLHLAALSAVVLSVLLETPEGPPREGAAAGEAERPAVRADPEMPIPPEPVAR